MSILLAVRRLLGIEPVQIGELNKQATRQSVSVVSKATLEDSLEGVQITDEYERIRSLIEAGRPLVFVTGNAGTGKSTLIRYLRATLKKRMAVVAPTGVAALNVGGVTIHSFFHLPPRIHEDKDIKLVHDRKLYQKLDLLIVDEVSMARCDLMDSIDKFLKKNRESSKPFGGVQLLLIGDLFQLPPVTKKREWDVLCAKGYSSHHFFSAFSLQNLSQVRVELSSVYRQNDASFVALLNRIRICDNSDAAIQEINARCYPKQNMPADITLTCTNDKADEINMEELRRISEREYTFTGEITGRFSHEEDRLPSPFNLKLKVGAHVMFTKNDERRRWVNGTLGIIRQIDQDNINIELITDSKGSTVDVHRVVWETYKYVYNHESDKIVSEKVGEYTQYPLMLAWAVTIHKSQGKTLDNALVDLGNGAFSPGQLYVALSRCRSMDGIRLARPIHRSDVKCDAVIKRFYEAMNQMKKGTERPS